MASKKKTAGVAVGTKAASKAARGAGRMALKGGKAQAKLTKHALSSREPAGPRYLKYGVFAILGFAVGALVARSRNRDDNTSSSLTDTIDQHTPDLGSPSGQRGETWGSGSSPASEHQRSEDPNSTGSERDYSDPSSGPLIGRTHRGRIGDVPEQQQEIENRIRTRVGEDPRTSDLPHLNVEVNDGVADIRGEAHSEEEKQAVEEIASGIEGVAEVRNLLTVNPDAPSRRDRGPGEPGDHSPGGI
jgi:BON domain